MQRYVIVVYDFYDLQPDGTARKIEKWEAVPFCERNIEYNDKLSYDANFESFIFECTESAVVFIEEGKYIPYHNIHGFYSDKYLNKTPTVPTVNDSQPVNPTPNIVVPQSSDNKKVVPPQNNQTFQKYKKIRHKHRRNRNNASVNVPFKVEKGENGSLSNPPNPPNPPNPSLPNVEGTI